MKVSIQELTSGAFAPYGTVIDQPASTAEANGPGWEWWSEAAVIPTLEQPYAVGYLALTPGPLEFDWAEYHLQSNEVIIPLGHECLIYVGPPGDEPEWERFEVFRIRQGQAVMLREGVWHGAPLALENALNALVLLRQGTGTNDVYKATHTRGPIQIVDEP